MTDDEKKLYPLRFCALEDTYDWGTDTFCVADLGYRDTPVKDGWLAANTLSEVMDTYMDRVTGDRPFERYGRQFPVQVKHIVCHGKMALRVHPCDETAFERYDALGREKLWYVACAGKNAVIYLGLKDEVGASDIIDGSFTGSLNAVHPVAGQSFIIPSGTIHGAEGEVEIVEVSESSALDFCVWSWGKSVSEEEFDPALNVVEALDFIDLQPYRAQPAAAGKDCVRLMAIPQFSVNKTILKSALHVHSDSPDTFSLYMCLYGEASVRCEIEGIGLQDWHLRQGEAILVPAEVNDFFLAPVQQTTSVLEVIVEDIENRDE